MAQHETYEAARLWTAAQRGETETVKAMMQRICAAPEADFEPRFSRVFLPALKVAIVNHHAPTVDAIAAHITWPSTEWYTLMDTAAQFGNVHAVRRFAFDAPNFQLQHALLVATLHSHARVVRALLAFRPTCVSGDALVSALLTRNRVVLGLLLYACTSEDDLRTCLCGVTRDSHYSKSSFFTAALYKWRKRRERRDSMRVS